MRIYRLLLIVGKGNGAETGGIANDAYAALSDPEMVRRKALRCRVETYALWISREI